MSYQSHRVSVRVGGVPAERAAAVKRVFDILINGLAWEEAGGGSLSAGPFEISTRGMEFTAGALAEQVWAAAEKFCPVEFRTDGGETFARGEADYRVWLSARAFMRREAGACDPVPPSATHLAVVVAGERVEQAWPCFGRDHAECVLRVWYAARRTIFCLDNTIALDDYAEGGPTPQSATVEEISDWYADGVAGYYVTVFELKATDPLEDALAELTHAPDYAEAVRAAVSAVKEAEAGVAADAAG